MGENKDNTDTSAVPFTWTDLGFYKFLRLRKGVDLWPTLGWNCRDCSCWSTVKNLPRCIFQKVWTHLSYTHIKTSSKTAHWEFRDPRNFTLFSLAPLFSAQNGPQFVNGQCIPFTHLNSVAFSRELSKMFVHFQNNQEENLSCVGLCSGQNWPIWRVIGQRWAAKARAPSVFSWLTRLSTKLSCWFSDRSLL